jgi:hypothetical protein
MKKYSVWIIAGVALLALIALAAWASAQTPMVARSSDEWSRGQVVGSTSVKRRVALQLAADGSAFLIWQNVGGRLELAHIGVDGEVLQTIVLSVGTGQSNDPRLRIGADGRLRLLWREGEHPGSVLHYAMLEPDGALVGQPQTMSDPAVSVLDPPCLIADAAGRYHVVWADDAGIQWTVLSADGTLLAGPTQVSTTGRFPAVQLDDRDRLHLVWQWQKRTHVETMYYAILDPDDVDGISDADGMSEQAEIAQVTLRTGQGLGEPAIGLTPGKGYVFWVVRDFKYVASTGQYVSFPWESPQQARVEPLPLWYGRYPEEPYVLESFQTPLWMALSASVPDQEVEDVVRSQIVVIEMGQDGSREQIVTASTQASLKPVLVADDRSNLHAAWLESTEFGRYHVVYGSTAPEVMENYNALSLWNVVDVAFSNVFRLSTMIVPLVAVLIMWALLPLIALVIYHLVTSEETLGTSRSLAALIVVLAFEVALTFIQPPRIGIEADWAALPLVAPTVSALVAAFVTVRTARRREFMHLFAAYFLFVAVSSVLQILIYALF